MSVSLAIARDTPLALLALPMMKPRDLAEDGALDGHLVSLVGTSGIIEVAIVDPRAMYMALVVG